MSSDIKTAILQAVLGRIDAGSGSSVLLLYSSPQPAAGAAITSQTLLASAPLADPAGTVTDNVLTLSTVADTLCVADGVLDWARLVDSTGAWCADMDITIVGGGGAITVDHLTVFTGGTIRTLSATLTEP